MKLFIEIAFGDYQSRFRSGSVLLTDPPARTIANKCYEYNNTFHQLFIDLKQAYESVLRFHLFNALRELGIPKQLISLVKMTLKGTKSEVKLHG